MCRSSVEQSCLFGGFFIALLGQHDSGTNKEMSREREKSWLVISAILTARECVCVWSRSNRQCRVGEDYIYKRVLEF